MAVRRLIALRHGYNSDDGPFCQSQFRLLSVPANSAFWEHSSAPERVVLLWETTIPGFVLEETSSLSSTSVWSVVTAPVSVIAIPLPVIRTGSETSAGIANYDGSGASVLQRESIPRHEKCG